MYLPGHKTVIAQRSFVVDLRLGLNIPLYNKGSSLNCLCENVPLKQSSELTFGTRNSKHTMHRDISTKK